MLLRFCVAIKRDHTLVLGINCQAFMEADFLLAAREHYLSTTAIANVYS